ncbi:hypothetical protein DHEL01_v202830 [Diaporthe helianthi]|uniref:Uncharacterized protein n=1 Tax=Diaporthe helianthi TaxID=158607 RepID=A0A2P5I8D6_DIAHE|nr:hypothetical protein DHEL01_v202830 [Diaporthe helianthi]
MLSVAACIGQSKWAYFKKKDRKLADIDVIEDAARGPLGSLIMLTSVPWSLATLGALITVLALGIDSFAQQVISNDAVTIWVNDGTASFGLARDYLGGARQSPSEMDHWIADPYTIDTSMQGAVMKAFYELEVPAIFNCSSNCSWDQTQALYKGGLFTPGHAPPSVPPAFVRLAAFRRPSVYREADITEEQVLECEIGLTAYNYTKASSLSNKFSIDVVAKIPLDNGYFYPNSTDAQVSSVGYLDKEDVYSYLLFNTSGLPDFRVRTLDIGALTDYFVSPSFSGTLADGESVPPFAPGITSVIGNPQKNISKMFESMATRMTDQLRSNYNALARGLSAKTVVLVRVQWAWLILPFVVVLASGTFLIAEMVESRRETNIKLWKSTATSLLFHSVSPAQGTMKTGVTDPEQLHKIAKATQVKLDGDKQ